MDKEMLRMRQTVTKSASISLSLLGVPRLMVGAQPVRLAYVKAEALLYYLAVTRRAQPRTVLAGLFWGDVDEYYARRNLNRTARESLDELSRVAAMARDAGTGLDVSLSVAFGCPFEGDVPVDRVVDLGRRFVAEGVLRVSFCDTTGMAAPPQVEALATALGAQLPDIDAAFHFHNTRGLALAGVLVALGAGIARFESSVGGLGGCPFAPNAAGNACTEDLVHMLHEMGLDTGLDLARLIDAARLAEELVGHGLDGQVMKSGPRIGLPHAMP